MRRLRSLTTNAAMVSIVLTAGLGLAACSDDGDGETTPTTTEASSGPRFCDAYLVYLGDSSADNLAAVDAAADDAQVSQYAASIEDPSTPIEGVFAATGDLDDLARSRCQAEWTAGAQGAGNTAAAAQALFDALIAGDRIGAANVASANALAVFEPWTPLGTAGDGPGGVGENRIVEVDEETFSLGLGEAIAVCQVETGVVIACQMS